MNLSAPNINNLINEYVDTIPLLPSTVTSGNSALAHYLNKHRFTDISLFTNPRFASKINQVARSPHEAEALWVLASRVNQRAQATFEQSNPN